MDKGQIIRTKRLHQLLGIASVGLDPVARLACNQRRGADPALKTLAGQIPLQPIAARTGFVDEHNPTRLALHTRAEPVDVAVPYSDITQAPALAQPERIRPHERDLVNNQSPIDHDILSHVY